MRPAKTLMDNLYTSLLAAVEQFREPAFAGRIVLRVQSEEGRGYVAEIKCRRGAGLEVGPIQDSS